MKKRSKLWTGLAALVAASLLSAWFGCGGKAGAGNVAAVVDGHKIYRSELEKYYQNETAGSNQAPSGEQAASLRLNILRELIDNEILMRRAEKLGLLATDDEVERKLSETKAPFTTEQFTARLAEKRITEEDFKRDIRRALTVEKVLNKEVTSKINVSDRDISDYYTSHKSEFNLIEPTYHLAQIFVTPVPNPQPVSYTHLDVYKRQLGSWRRSTIWIRPSGVRSFPERAMSLSLIHI